MDIINKNPFRILGVYSNAHTNDIKDNINKINDNLKEGKKIEFVTDLNAVLPTVERTVENIVAAQASINQAKDRIKHAFFWFADDDALDKTVIDQINNREFDKAKKALKCRNTYSALLNLGVLAIIDNNLTLCFNCYAKLISDENTRCLFVVECSGDSRILLSEDELVDILLDVLIANFSMREILSALMHCTNSSSIDFFKLKVEKFILNQINIALDAAINADKTSDAQYRSGKELMDVTDKYLIPLKEMDKYEYYYQIYDNVAMQLLRCGHFYIKDFYDVEKEDAVKRMQRFAFRIAVRDNVKEECYKMYDFLKKAPFLFPPILIKNELEHLKDLIISFKSTEQTLKDTLSFLDSCNPYVAEIRSKLGDYHRLSMKISAYIAMVALLKADTIINNLLNEAKTSLGSVPNSVIKSSINDAWQICLYLSIFDLKGSNKDFYLQFKHNIQDYVLLFNPECSSEHSCKFETEDAIFNKCVELKDYETYVKRFPSGKHLSQAYDKITEINKIEQEERNKLIEKIDTIASVQEGADIVDKCRKHNLKDALDDKCFSVCKCKSDYKMYLNMFMSARHIQEVNKHFLFERILRIIKRDLKLRRREIPYHVISLIGLCLLGEYSLALIYAGTLSGFKTLFILFCGIKKMCRFSFFAFYARYYKGFRWKVLFTEYGIICALCFILAFIL